MSERYICPRRSWATTITSGNVAITDFKCGRSSNKFSDDAMVVLLDMDHQAKALCVVNSSMTALLKISQALLGAFDSFDDVSATVNGFLAPGDDLSDSIRVILRLVEFFFS